MAAWDASSMPETDRLRRRGARLTVAAALGLPLTAVVVGSLPLGWRRVAYVAALAAIAVCGIAGGWAARAALLRGVPRTARTVAVAIIGLTIGVTAGIVLILGLVSEIL